MTGETPSPDPAGGRLRPLARPFRLSLDSYARITGVHPDVIRRLVALGLLERDLDDDGSIWFAPSQVREMARIQRVHLRLNLTYSSLGLVLDLLDRISELERSHRRSRSEGGPPWT